MRFGIGIDENSPYKKVYEWEREQLKRIERLNKGFVFIDKEGNIEKDNMTLSPEWNNEEHDPAHWNTIQMKCKYCSGELTQRNPRGKDTYIFEFTLGENLDGQIPNTLAKRMCHEYCFLKYVGKMFYDNRHYIENSNPYDWNCGLCGVNIPANTKGTSLVTIRKCSIYDRDHGHFQVQGHIHFCIGCWVNMAGEKFFT